MMKLFLRSLTIVSTGALFLLSSCVSLESILGPQTDMSVSGAKLHIKLNGIVYPDAEEITDLIKAGEDVNYVSPVNGRTLLITAAAKSVPASADDDKFDKKRRVDSLEYCKILVTSGLKNLDAAGNDGMTALGFAVSYNNFDLVKYLVEKGANLDTYQKDGMTPLGIALFAKRADLALYLIDQGANVDLAQKETGMTPLHFATMSSALGPVVAKLIQRGANVNALAEDRFVHMGKGITPLFYSAYLGDIDTVIKLIDAGTELNAMNEYHVNALFYSVLTGREKAGFVVSYLLDHGASAKNVFWIDGAARFETYSEGEITANQLSNMTTLQVAKKYSNSLIYDAILSHSK